MSESDVETWDQEIGPEEQAGTYGRQTTPTERWKADDPPPKPRPETAAVLAASLHQFQPQKPSPDFSGTRGSLPLYSYDACLPGEADLSGEPHGYSEEDQHIATPPRPDPPPKPRPETAAVLAASLYQFQQQNPEFSGTHGSLPRYSYDASLPGEADRIGEPHDYSDQEVSTSHKKIAILAKDPPSLRRSIPKNEPNFWCSTCHEGFKREKDLNRHIETEHGEHYFQCRDCDYSYPRKDKLVQHCRERHRDSSGFKKIARSRTLSSSGEPSSPKRRRVLDDMQTTQSDLTWRASEDSIDLNSSIQDSISQIQFHPLLILPEDLKSATAGSTTLVSNHDEPKFLEGPSIGYSDMWNPPSTLSSTTNFDEPSVSKTNTINKSFESDSLQFARHGLTQAEGLRNVPPSVVTSKQNTAFSIDDTTLSAPIHCCNTCQKMFVDDRKLRKHVNQVHTPRFKCSADGCHRTFWLRAELRRHERSSHDLGSLALFNCPEPGCSFVATRTDNVLRHLRGQHGLGPDSRSLSQSGTTGTASIKDAPAGSLLREEERDVKTDEELSVSNDSDEQATQFVRDRAIDFHKSQGEHDRADDGGARMEHALQSFHNALIGVGYTDEQATLFVEERKKDIHQARAVNASCDVEQSMDQDDLRLLDNVQLEASYDDIFKENISYDSGDETSVGSGENTLATSSSIFASRKGSSTQPTTAGISKRGSAHGDDKNVEHMDTRDDPDDADSIRTDNREVHMLNETKAKLSRYFAAELFSGIQAVRGSGRTISRESVSGLPELLRQFSWLAEQRVRSSLDQRAVAFVRHRRNAIASYFRSKCGAASEREPQARSGMADPNYVDRMDILWRGDVTGTADQIAEIPLDQDLASIPDSDDVDDEEGTSFPPDIEVAIDFLLAGEECQWLLSQVHIASQTMTTGDTFMKVRRSLTEYLGDYRQLVFEVSWNPLTFVQQQYNSTEAFDIGLAVCISGKAELAQAMTCKEYIEMMWPNTGTSIVSTLNQLIRQSLNLTEGAQLDDSTRCIDQMMVSNDHLTVDATGSRIELLELGEVLAWLGAACRASNSNRITYCSPQVTCDGFKALSINYEFSEVDNIGVETNGSGRCWLKIFNNPTIVKGYPIRSREEREPGLEIPLKLAAVLGYAQFADNFDGHFLLKGPYSALVPKMQRGSSVIWHFTVNDDGQPMTYKQALSEANGGSNIDSSCLECTRHFVGWTRNVKNLTGTTHAQYNDIRHGGRIIESAGYVLSEVSMSIGYKWLGISATIRPAKKDFHCFPGIDGPYDLQIKATGTLRVVLYDDSQSRGWLVDGASFVLHLARAALSHRKGHYAHSADSLVEQFVHRDQQSLDGQPTSAKDVLLNPRNMQIEISPNFYFKELMLRYCNVIGKLKELQENRRESRQRSLKDVLVKRNVLEGFDFLGILRTEPGIRIRAVELTRSAAPWLKVMETSGALNVVGSDFGDIYISEHEQCEAQRYVPCGVHFLAAPVRILDEIAEERCCESKDCIKLATDIVWAEPSASFANKNCFCRHSQKIRKCSVDVTEIRPSHRMRSSRNAHCSMRVDIDYSAGAVIFGQQGDLANTPNHGSHGARTAIPIVASQAGQERTSRDSGIGIA